MLKKRIEVEISIMGLMVERALILPHSSYGDVLISVLSEFASEIPYLDQSHPEMYEFVPAGQKVPISLHKRVNEDAGSIGLYFREKPFQFGRNQKPFSRPIYFRHQDRIFPVRWQGAIIGRPDPNAEWSSQLAVDLESISNRVSRCQAELFEVDAAFWLRPLSANPMWINGNPIPFNPQSPELSNPIRLKHFDRIGLGFQSVELITLIPERVGLE